MVKRYPQKIVQLKERQETEFVDAINQAFKKNKGNPFTLVTNKSSIKNVVAAEKFSGTHSAGFEPYTDIILHTTRRSINLSMKGTNAPSLAGGGLKGVESIIPGIGAKFFKAAHNNHIKRGLKLGDKVPDTYAKLKEKDKLLLVTGNKEIGGPIDYIYIGPMEIISHFKNNVLSVNGKCISAIKFARTHELFFRLRSRRNDQSFDPNAIDENGIPKIYSKSPSKGDSSGRLVISDKISSKGEIIIL